MWSMTVNPRFVDTDALGHINNTVLPVWFEEARTPIFRIFTPDLNPSDWHLIIAKIEVEFLAELFYGYPVEVKTYFEKIGNSSMVVIHEAWQNDSLCSRGKAVLVHYDHALKQSKPLTSQQRDILIPHLTKDSA